jgi:NDP-sugar pyrophosphorylase family protein
MSVVLNVEPQGIEVDFAGTPVVILAGGRGTRLAPYTSVLPKPLMPVGDRSILEIVIDQLGSHGFRNINLSVGYLAHLIRAVFDHANARDGVEITFVHEEEALGTAAPLHLIDGLDRTFVVMNGDVLTTIDYADIVRYHHAARNMLTIATHVRTVKINYGMLDLDVMARVREFYEKPEIVSPVSMGIYVMEPEVLEYVPEGSYFDFPDLVRALLAAGQPIGAYRFHGKWFDIGREDDYAEAVLEWETNGLFGDGAGANGSGNGHVDVNGNHAHSETGGDSGAPPTLRIRPEGVREADEGSAAPRAAAGRARS